jgi:hypothetical protein
MISLYYKPFGTQFPNRIQNLFLQAAVSGVMIAAGFAGETSYCTVFHPLNFSQ